MPTARRSCCAPGRKASRRRQLIARMAGEHQRDFAGFQVGFDNYYSTHSDENRTLAGNIYRETARRRPHQPAHHQPGLRPGKADVPAGPLHQGRVPALRRRRPVRRQLRGVRRHLRADRAEEPGLGAVRRHAGAKGFRALLLQAGGLRGPGCGWTTCAPPAAGGRQQDGRMVRDRPARLGHLARRALLRLRDPGCAGQVLLRLAGCADRLHGQLQKPVRPARAGLRRLVEAGRDHRAVSLHRQGHPATSTPCSGRPCCAAPASARRRRSSRTAS